MKNKNIYKVLVSSLFLLSLDKAIALDTAFVNNKDSYVHNISNNLQNTNTSVYSDAQNSKISNNLPQSKEIGGQDRTSVIFNNNLIKQSKNEGYANPAWGQDSYVASKAYRLMPFGSFLFNGNFSNTYADSLNDNYIISTGDRIVIRVWGAKNYDDVLVVDQQGNIFVPEVGPIHVAGLTHNNLLSHVKNTISQIFTNNIDVYVNLQNSQPVGVFVTGFVNRPGQYAGGTFDSILSFIDRAGGIDYTQGSYREILVKRNNSVIAKIDLYDFILNGSIKNLRLKDGDVILVQRAHNIINVYGEVKDEYRYELNNNLSGSALIKLVNPLASVTHVSISGIRNSKPINKYITLKDFDSFKLCNEDIVDFVADNRATTILTTVKGAILGQSRFPVAKATKLRDLLEYIEIDESIADTGAIYIKRKSIAEQQKLAIAQSLNRLEQNALTATSGSYEEAQIRVQEANLIKDFVQRAKDIEPDGVVVVARKGVINNILLEEDDEIIIPQKSDVVVITGEVMMPKAIAFDKKMSLDDYLAAAGGVSNKANDNDILVAKANGDVGRVNDLGIESGDRIIVLPRVDTKGMQFAKDITQILYQIAVATKVAVDL